MSVRKLIDALEKEAELREKAILEKARTQADQQTAFAMEQAAKMDRAIEAIRKELEAKKQTSAIAKGRLDARAGRLREGWAMVRQAFELTRTMYGDFMKTPGYQHFIQGLLNQAEERIGPLEKVVADPVTAKAINSSSTISVEVDEGQDMGFTAYSAAGDRVTHCTFSLMLERLWNQEETAHYGNIFQEPGDAD